MGRRKIEMTKVLDSSSRQVTFSKRRTGLFKKAHELAILTGCHIAIIVFSPGGKPYSFGSPSVNVVADRFLNQEEYGDDDDNADVSIEEHNARRADEMAVEKLGRMMRKYEAYKKKIEVGKKAQTRDEWEKKLKTMSRSELEAELVKLDLLLDMIEEVKKARASEMEASSSLLMLANKEEMDFEGDDDNDFEGDDEKDDVVVAKSG